MALVAALLHNPAHLNRLRAAIRQRYSVVACADWPELMRSCEREAVALVVVDLYTDKRADFDKLRELKRLHPSVARVLYVSAPPVRLCDVFEAGRFGLDGLIVFDHDDSSASIVATLDQAEARGLTETLRAELRAAAPTVRDATLIAVTRAHQRLTPERLASVLGMRSRSLAERLRHAGFPPPQRLITWGRLIVAAQMLEDPERSADSIALALDFPSGSAFRNSCQRYLRATPHTIRERGGARWVTACLLAEIGAVRQSAHSSKRQPLGNRTLAVAV